ncbi:MAG: hypothetical protein IMF19_06265, partial [Proteobacteria bacterium]|nr:hypothetical protein [Pseudomonadota bacterium]
MKRYRGLPFTFYKNNLTSYLSENKVLACGGSWMVKAELISSGNFAEITRLTREAV